jgi:hypothetical protein
MSVYTRERLDDFVLQEQQARREQARMKEELIQAETTRLLKDVTDKLNVFLMKWKLGDTVLPFEYCPSYSEECDRYTKELIRDRLMNQLAPQLEPHHLCVRESGVWLFVTFAEPKKWTMIGWIRHKMCLNN